jgi:glucosamine-6-phosphate deaminase
MDFNYLDREGRAMTRQEVHQLPAAALAERSGVSLRILPNREALYEAVAEVMVQTIEAKRGSKTTMILPVGRVGQYPAFARKAAERGLDCRNLWTFNMDEFLDRNGRTVPERCGAEGATH